MTGLTTLAATALAHLSALAPYATDPVPEPSDVRPGWITLVVVLSLCAATTLLWLSFRKHLGRIQIPREGEGEDERDAPVAPDDQRSSD